MNQASRLRYKPLLIGLMGASVLGLALPALAAAPTRHATAASSARQGVDAQLAAARARHDALQAQVTQQEQHNADQQKQLQQRDAEIAALQHKLQAAGAPASAASSGH